MIDLNAFAGWKLGSGPTATSAMMKSSGIGTLVVTDGGSGKSAGATARATKCRSPSANTRASASCRSIVFAISATRGNTGRISSTSEMTRSNSAEPSMANAEGRSTAASRALAASRSWTSPSATCLASRCACTRSFAVYARDSPENRASVPTMQWSIAIGTDSADRRSRSPPGRSWMMSGPPPSRIASASGPVMGSAVRPRALAYQQGTPWPLRTTTCISSCGTNCDATALRW